MNHLFSPVILALGSMLATFTLVVAPAPAVADDAATPHASLTGKDGAGRLDDRCARGAPQDHAG